MSEIYFLPRGSYRIGQKRESKVSILRLNETYDQILQYRAAIEMEAQMSGQNILTATDQEMDRARLHSGGENEDRLRGRIVATKAADLYRQMMGRLPTPPQPPGCVGGSAIHEKEKRLHSSPTFKIYPPRDYTSSPKHYCTAPNHPASRTLWVIPDFLLPG